jgi:hypothetical protein
MVENEGILDGHTVLIDRPTIQVIDCEVQHPTSRGGLTHIKGTLGVGLIIQPSGQPKIMLKIEHADGANLVAFVDRAELVEFCSMLMDADDQANEVCANVAKALRS